MYLRWPLCSFEIVNMKQTLKNVDSFIQLKMENGKFFKWVCVKVIYCSTTLVTSQHLTLSWSRLVFFFSPHLFWILSQTIAAFPTSLTSGKGTVLTLGWFMTGGCGGGFGNEGMVYLLFGAGCTIWKFINQVHECSVINERKQSFSCLISVISRFSTERRSEFYCQDKAECAVIHTLLLQALQTTEPGSQIISALVTFNWVSQLFPAQQALYCFFLLLLLQLWLAIWQKRIR